VARPHTSPQTPPPPTFQNTIPTEISIPNDLWEPETEEQPAKAARPRRDESSTPEWPLVHLLKQNLFAVAGVCLLLLGFTFLFRSIQWGQLVPPWARIAFAYAASAALVWAGLRWSEKKPLWAQIAQGGAAGVAYLATYIAATRFELFSSGVAMALFALISLSLVARALIENSKVLAAIGFLGAYAAPMLALDRGGAFGFNLSYGLLVTAFALWVSYYRQWIEIAIHAHVCAVGLAVLTYQTHAEPLAPWLQQTLLHAYLAQLLLWGIGWSRRWLPTDVTEGELDPSTAVLVTCLSATVLCYLALQSWLVPQQLTPISLALAALLLAMGFSAFAGRPPLREASWVLAALSAVVALNSPDLLTVFKGLGLVLEGAFLTLTVRAPNSLRAWLGRLLVGAGAVLILVNVDTDGIWALAVLLLATMALALWFSPRESSGTAREHQALDGFYFGSLSIVSLGALALEQCHRDPVLLLAIFTSGSALMAAVACWRCRGFMPAVVVYAGAAALSWAGLAALPIKSQPELQLSVLVGVLLPALVAAWFFVPRDDETASLSMASIGSPLLFLLPALFVYKLSTSLILLLVVVTLGLVAAVWAASSGALGRLWRITDDTPLRQLGLAVANVLPAFAVVIWVTLPDMKGADVVVLGFIAFLACMITWTVHAVGVDAGIRHVAGTSFALIGLFGWGVAAMDGTPAAALHSTLDSQLLPVLLTTMAVGFLFHASRTGQRIMWRAAALVCAASSVKLLVSLGSALLSPIGVAASLLGMGALLLLAGYLAPLPPDEEQAAL
jgi:uncharacterized membrane protein